MYWELVTKSGEKLQQLKGTKIPPDSEIQSIILRETPAQYSLPFDADAGVVHFTNLDIQKTFPIEAARRMPDLHLTYDYKDGVYRLDEKDREFIKDNTLTDTTLFLSFELTAKQDFEICGVPMNLALIPDEDQTVNLFETDVTNREAEYLNEAFSDMIKGRIYKTQMKNESGILFTQLGVRFNSKWKDYSFFHFLRLRYLYHERQFELGLFTECDRHFKAQMRFTTPEKVKTYPITGTPGLTTRLVESVWHYSG